ncbi:MAG TPA: hypothetical protein VFL79_19620 [Terriglobia bacterium]|nr:hypothetical protein [Terriglobia bacterium]
MLNIDNFERFQPTLKIRHRDHEGTMVPFVANPNQQKLHDAYRRQVNEGLPLRIISVKARRTGISRDCLSVGYAHLLSTPGAYGTIAAHLSSTAEELFSQVEEWYKGFPAELGKPTKKYLTFPHKTGKSTLVWGTAKNAVGGRGGTRSWLMVSEAAYIEIAAFSALMSMVSKTDRNTIIQVESTANGKVGTGEAFFRLWDEAWSATKRRKFTSFVPIFLGWLEDPGCVRDPKEAKDAPASDLERELMRDFKATKAQVAWMRDTMITYCNGLEDVFSEQYPWTADVAFLSTGNPAFTRKELRIAARSVDEGRCLFKGRLFGATGAYEPIPDKEGPWRVFQMPERGHFYYLAGDSARGDAGKDYASGCVFDGITGEQVATFLGRPRPNEFAFELNSAGYFYPHGNQPGKLLLEITGTTGGITQSVLRDTYRYPNFYYWKGARNDRPSGKYGLSSLGWEMTERSRKRALEQFRTDLSATRIFIRDPECLEQMEVAQRGGGGTYDWQIEEGHDDLFTSTLLAWICASDFPAPAMLQPTRKPELNDGSESRLVRAIESEENGFGFLAMTSKHLRELERKAQHHTRMSRLY